MSALAWGDLWFLVVDDNPQFRRLIRGLLSAFGADNVLEAESADEATRLLWTHHVDVAIVDHLLGARTGLAWTRWLVHDPESPRRDLPVILVSGHNDERLARAALVAGAKGFLRKPFGARDLWIRVAQILTMNGPRREDTPPEAAGQAARTVRSSSRSP
ncbi:MAG: response regulator [Rhodospirillum sp.]|nr:response regulator [Rhodospirillum sp.]MCF8491731.1 response regulator [Rhodospirillum sp.]MCF8499448.1 response regulator [Rhodospirillum sp.]